jgi:methylase of polypeptide subunit release factors
VALADDRMPADTAFRLAAAGTALLWRGDFQNARHLLQALTRRLDKRHSCKPPSAKTLAAPDQTPQAAAALAFHQHRMAQAQRAQVLSALLIPLQADGSIPLRRAPDWRAACAQVWGPPQALGDDPVAVQVTPLRELLGIVSAYEWRKNGVPVSVLGAQARIHPHHGVFSPVRGEYLELVAQAPWPVGAVQGGPAARGGAPALAYDIGTGTGVLAALLAQRGVAQVLATDVDPRALACAAQNVQHLGLQARVQLLHADLFPPRVDPATGQSAGLPTVVVCNPPWLPARAASAIERTVYDEGSRMLRGFLAGLAEHLAPGGEGWLILSDLAEHLGLRSRAQLLGWIAAAHLHVVGRIDTRPHHRKALDAADPLHAARAAEVTSLWRLSHLA